MEGSTLTLFFDRGLDKSSRPAGSRFKVHGHASGAYFEVQGTGTARVSGATVVVTLKNALPTVEDAWVDYDRGNESRPLRGADGARVTDIANWLAAGLDGTGPVAAGGTVSGTDVTLYYDEALDERYVPASAAFAVADSAATPPSVDEVKVKGSAVFLTLDREVMGAASDVSVRYSSNEAGPSGRLRDTAGNEAVDFTFSGEPALTIEQTSAPAGKPALVAADPAVADKHRLTLTFDQRLDPTKVPENGAFALSPFAFGGVIAVTVDGTAVELRLGDAVMPCDGITVYADGTWEHNDDIRLTYAQPALNALRDAWSTKADGFDRQVVVNKNANPTDCVINGITEAGLGSIILTGRRPFAQDAPPRAAWFTVTASGGPVAVTGAAFDPADPRKLRLSLSRDFAPDETATVSYRRPLGARGLWFVDGAQLADVVDLPVRMRAQAAAPAVEAVAVVSDPGTDADLRGRRRHPGAAHVRRAGDGGHGAGHAAPQARPRRRVGLGRAVGGLRLGQRRDGADVFAYTAVSGDTSTNGVAVLADTLELDGGTGDPSAAGADAALAHAGLDPDAGHTVDTAAPGFASAAVDGSTLTVTFDEDLDTESAPPVSAFTVTAAPADGAERAIAGTGTAGVAGAAVTVTLADAAAHGETLTVAYAPPDENPIRDLAGNAAAAFSGEAAANGTAAPAPAVEAVALVSDPGADGTYAAGDAIRVRVTFAAAVTVDTAQGTPRLKLDLGGEARARASGGRCMPRAAARRRSRSFTRRSPATRRPGRRGARGHAGARWRHAPLGGGRRRGIGPRGPRPRPGHRVDTARRPRSRSAAVTWDNADGDLRRRPGRGLRAARERLHGDGGAGGGAERAPSPGRARRVVAARR